MKPALSLLEPAGFMGLLVKIWAEHCTSKFEAMQAEVAR